MFRGLPKDVDFMAAVDDAASANMKVNGTLTPLRVYNPYEGFPFAHAYASFTHDGYSDAEVECSQYWVRIPDGYMVDWNANGTRMLLFREGNDLGFAPEVLLTDTGHADGRYAMFALGDDEMLALRLLDEHGEAVA